MALVIRPLFHADTTSDNKKARHELEGGAYLAKLDERFDTAEIKIEKRIRNNTRTRSSYAKTIESFAVALILAFMFRAFVAEIFVIPTGSMAPTLMGAHKDVQSSETGFQFQSGASFEFVAESGAKTGFTAVGTTCPLSRKTEMLDLANNANHTTFSGDRIIVSKFSYIWNDPKRWDVIVFKYPYNARINYIKRCIGLPNETLRIEGGDIYVRPKAKLILRSHENRLTWWKRLFSQSLIPTTLLTQQWRRVFLVLGNPILLLVKVIWVGISRKLTKIFRMAGLLSMNLTKWEAQFKPSGEKNVTAWLRYHHRVLSRTQWAAIEKSGKLPAPIPKYTSRSSPTSRPTTAIRREVDQVFTLKTVLSMVVMPRVGTQQNPMRTAS